MSIKLQLPQLTDLRPRLTVIGVGGAGCNAINNMIAAGLHGVEFVVANTDAQALAASSAEHRIQLGVNLTEGLGAGSKPEIGQAAAEEAIEEIRAQVAGSHMVFIAAGMGGGTGTGAAAVIARAAKELGILTVGVVTKPFQFEGARRARIAEAGITELRNNVDTLIVIPNQNLFRVANEKTTFAEAFVLADQVLYSGVACVVDLIVKEGLINLDFADVRTVMSGMGTAMMGTGEASGEGRATLAAEEAIANPLLDDVTLRGARGLLLSITGSSNLTLYEVDEAASRVRQEVDPDANIIVGATFDESLGDRVRVSIVASGMARSEQQRPHHAGPSTTDQRAAPPPIPAAQFASDPAVSSMPEGEVTRRLSDAIVGGYDPLPHPMAPQGRAASEPPRPSSREAWLAPGNVLIEEASPTHGTAGPPHGSPRHDYEPTGYQNDEPRFAPAPPADIRRGGRRMPEVEDFPVVGQREYRARMGYDRSDTGAPPVEPTLEDQHRKPGLLERLTGRSKRHGESAAKSSAGANHSTGARAGAIQPGRYDDRQRGPHGAGQQDASGSAERGGPDGQLPMFFNRERR